ncbi:MAG: GFA family protein [Sphingomonas sp.]|uniref:GFA family protein n=1 Tax=Sphingomonas sp. TaxID=28214 RepID=UPI0012004A4F|nr:GFA family protein [Sphingomonas sp.]THD35145.1 MAG: GFA family protein [Sphingomonas sp.]
MTAGAGCRCGQVRIAIAGDPVRVRTCWCRDCQYWGSGNGTTNAAYRREDLTIDGQVTWFDGVADSGNPMSRGFCPVCGTPLFTGNGPDAPFLAIRVGALDDPNAVRPTETIWVASAPDWASIDTDLPQSAGQPPSIK